MLLNKIEVVFTANISREVFPRGYLGNAISHGSRSNVAIN